MHDQNGGPSFSTLKTIQASRTNKEAALTENSKKGVGVRRFIMNSEMGKAKQALAVRVRTLIGVGKESLWGLEGSHGCLRTEE